MKVEPFTIEELSVQKCSKLSNAELHCITYANSICISGQNLLVLLLQLIMHLKLIRQSLATIYVCKTASHNLGYMKTLAKLGKHEEKSCQ